MDSCILPTGDILKVGDWVEVVELEEDISYPHPTEYRQLVIGDRVQIEDIQLNPHNGNILVAGYRVVSDEFYRNLLFPVGWAGIACFHIRKIASGQAQCTCTANQLLWGGCMCGYAKGGS